MNVVVVGCTQLNLVMFTQQAGPPRTGMLMLMLSKVACLRNDADNFVRSAPEMVVHVYCCVAGRFDP